jgi:hypothetical protein
VRALFARTGRAGVRRIDPHSDGSMASCAGLGYRERDLPHSGKALPMPRHLLAAAATGALLLGLAGCGDEEEGAVTTPPPSISVGAPSDGGGEANPSDGGGSETGAPTAEAPDIPPSDYAGMDQRTPEGAEQAFRYFIAVTYWGHQSGSAELLRELQRPSCTECEKLANKIETNADAGQLWSATEVTDYGSEVYDSENYDVEIGYIYIVSAREQDRGNAGASAPAPERAYTAIGGLDWVENRWLVGGVEIEETESEL